MVIPVLKKRSISSVGGGGKYLAQVKDVWLHSAHHTILCSSVASILSPKYNDEAAILFAPGLASASPDAAVQ